MPAHAVEADPPYSRHRAAPYAERADQADHVRRSTLQGRRCRLPAAERRKPFSGKHLLVDAGPWLPVALTLNQIVYPNRFNIQIARPDADRFLTVHLLHLK